MWSFGVLLQFIPFASCSQAQAEELGARHLADLQDTLKDRAARPSVLQQDPGDLDGTVRLKSNRFSQMFAFEQLLLGLLQRLRLGNFFKRGRNMELSLSKNAARQRAAVANPSFLPAPGVATARSASVEVPITPGVPAPAALTYDPQRPSFGWWPNLMSPSDGNRIPPSYQDPFMFPQFQQPNYGTMSYVPGYFIPPRSVASPQLFQQQLQQPQLYPQRLLQYPTMVQPQAYPQPLQNVRSAQQAVALASFASFVQLHFGTASIFAVLLVLFVGSAIVTSGRFVVVCRPRSRAEPLLWSD